MYNELQWTMSYNVVQYTMSYNEQWATIIYNIQWARATMVYNIQWATMNNELQWYTIRQWATMNNELQWYLGFSETLRLVQWSNIKLMLLHIESLPRNDALWPWICPDCVEFVSRSARLYFYNLTKRQTNLNHVEWDSSCLPESGCCWPKLSISSFIETMFSQK